MSCRMRILLGRRSTANSLDEAYLESGYSLCLCTVPLKPGCWASLVPLWMFLHMPGTDHVAAPSLHSSLYPWKSHSS